MVKEALKIDNNELEFYEIFFSYVMAATKDCFAQFNNGEATVNRPIPDSIQINYDHWVCAITIKLDVATVGIKLHYSSAVARILASKRLQQPPNSIPNKILGDIIQEYINLVMGQIKKQFSSVDISVMIPQTAPARDMEDPRSEVLDRSSTTWQLFWPHESVFFSCIIKIEKDISEIDLDKLREPCEEDDNDGDMEFL